MKVIEKLNYDKDLLTQHFAEWCEGPGHVRVDTDSRDDSFRSAYRTYHYERFVLWAFDEYKEFHDGDITAGGTIIVSADMSDCMKVLAFNLFDTGWPYRFECLRKKHGDLTKPFEDYVEPKFRQSLDDKWTDEKKAWLVERIGEELTAHNPNSGRCYCYTSANIDPQLRKEQETYYHAYDAVLNEVLAALAVGDTRLSMDYVNEITGRNIFPLTSV